MDPAFSSGSAAPPTPWIPFLDHGSHPDPTWIPPWIPLSDEPPCSSFRAVSECEREVNDRVSVESNAETEGAATGGRGECNTETEDEHTRSMQTNMGHAFQDAQQTEVRHRPRLEDAPRQEDATCAANVILKRRTNIHEACRHTWGMPFRTRSRQRSDIARDWRPRRM